MKNIKIIIAIAISLVSILGNSVYGYAGTTQPVDSTPPAEVSNEATQTNSNDSLDSRATVAEMPATLQYIVKFRGADAAHTLARINDLTRSAAQTSLSQIGGKQARIDTALSGQAFLVTFADQAQVNLVRSHMSPSESSKVTAATSASASELEIEYMVPNLRREISLTPDDTNFNRQIQYHATAGNRFGANLESAWDITTGSVQIVIAVLDTGIRYEHPDLAGRLLPGYDFVSLADMGNDGDGRDADPSDPGDWITPEETAQIGGNFYKCSAASSHWHGTHVAGIIGAQGNNQYGVAGANWVSKILPVRVMGKCGGYDGDIVDGIRWAAGLDVPGAPINPTPARVINLSLGGTGACTAAYQDAINEVTSLGVVVVAAAGNQRGDANNFTPANCNNVISVGSVSTFGNRASYTNAGSSVTISSLGGDEGAVPGDGVLSTADLGTTTPMSSSFKTLNGTSMAAAQVSGIVSLLLSAQPMLTPESVRFVLRMTATAFPATSNCNTSLCGAGIINAFTALQKVLGLETDEPTQPVAPNEPNAPSEPIQLHTLFLPMTTNDSTATGSASINATVNITNGNFENGAQDWQMNSSIGLENLILNRIQLPADRTPHSGEWMSWLGGMNNETSTIAMPISVPAQHTNLMFWKRVKSVETDCAHDTAQILINNQPVAALLLCATTASTTWSSETVDLSAFAGQTVELKFQVTTDGADSSSLFLDDVAFQSN